jgi:hypothetical protein
MEIIRLVILPFVFQSLRVFFHVAAWFYVIGVFVSDSIRLAWRILQVGLLWLWGNFILDVFIEIAWNAYQSIGRSWQFFGSDDCCRFP